MQKRKKQILEAAVRLFARKGFHATSIQEIVDEVGIAKGSIYFYFKSKEELLVSLFEHYETQWYGIMAEQPGEEGLSPREKLRLQLERLFRFLKDNADFFHMFLKEPLSGEQHQQMRMIAHRFRYRYMNWLYRQVQNLYGESERYWADGVLLLSGMIQSFMGEVILDRDAVRDDRLSAFLLGRLDDVMSGMRKEGGSPIVGERNFRRMIAVGLEEASGEEGLRDMLEQLAKQTQGTEAEETVGLLTAELGKAAPHPVVVRALLALLEKQVEPNHRDTLAGLMKMLEKG